MSTYSPFVAALHVFIGGGAGAVLRWQLGRAMTGWLGAPIVTAFPFATLAANAAGSLLMGLLAGWLARHGSGEKTWDALQEGLAFYASRLRVRFDREHGR